MPHHLQLTPGGADAIAACPRWVYLAPFTEETGYRWVWSVSSKGVRVGLRCIPPGADFTPYIDALWDELDDVDPVEEPTPAFASRPALRLIAS